MPPARRPERERTPAEAGRHTLRCLQWRSDQQWEEEKPLNNHLERFEEEREDFSCRRVARTGNQQRAPGRQNSNSAPLQTSNERLDRAAGPPHRDRRPANRARKRQGGADARRSLRSSTKAADSPSTAGGHSWTPAPDAEATAATLYYDRSK